MTLIVEIRDPNVSGSVFITDCLVSMDRQDGDIENQFPLHYGSGWNIDTKGVKLASKALTGKNRMILGSGYVDEIERVAFDFLNYSDKNVSNEDAIAEFQSFLDEFYLEKSKNESFIYSICDGRGPIIADSYCLPPFKVGHLFFTCGGKGAEYFKDWIQKLKPDPNGSLFELSAELLAGLIRLEFTDYGFKDHNFGSAYELIFLDESGFRRASYSVIDCTTDSILCDDGVYEYSTVKLERVILCHGKQHGSLFAVNFHDGSNRPTVVFEACEVFKDDLLDGSLVQVKEMMNDFDSLFDIVLIRHKDVNYRLSTELIDISNLATHGTYIVNEEKLRAVITSGFV